MIVSMTIYDYNIFLRKSENSYIARFPVYDKSRFSIKWFEKRDSFILAQREGFEPSSRFSDYTISNRARYDHFDTAAGHKHCLQSSWTATIIIPDF